jgi:hypothetical protein
MATEGLSQRNIKMSFLKCSDRNGNCMVPVISREEAEMDAFPTDSKNPVRMSCDELEENE